MKHAGYSIYSSSNSTHFAHYFNVPLYLKKKKKKKKKKTSIQKIYSFLGWAKDF